MERAVFRPLRSHSPAIDARHDVRDLRSCCRASRCSSTCATAPIGEPASSLARAEPGGHDRRRRRPQGHDRRGRRRGRRAAALLALLLGRTTIGLHMRAAATDFRTARMLGVQREPGDRLRGPPLGRPRRRSVAVILTVQQPLVTPDFALHETIIVLVGVVVGGIDRLWTATLGGFAIGFAHRRDRRRAADREDDLPAVGRVRARDRRAARPARRALRAAAAVGGGAGVSARGRLQLLGPCAARRRSSASSSWFASAANDIYFLNALVSVAIVVALYVFVGNSGVLSFGHISFVAVGAFCAGRDDGAARVEVGACCRTCSRSCATTRSATCRR